MSFSCIVVDEMLVCVCVCGSFVSKISIVVVGPD